jgi:hypothetical protein
MANERNADGLLVKYGISEGQAGKAGEWRTDTNQRVIDLELQLSTLTTSSTVIDTDVTLDKGWLVESVAVIGTEAAASGTSLSVGVVDTDGTSNAVTTGILNAQLTANMALGPNTTVATGATVKTILASNKLLTALVAGTFTAGKVRIQITCSKP